ncbi:LacI family DNA-binding transcriptional regulator [Truepera radiovictrix]|nr:LacI family DNA-binding transcriptional regulator [Truepera radiovictrix]WMT56604.1 LacI family DNA-binding transcriptional regulator [Truepera radiovictrix]
MARGGTRTPRAGSRATMADVARLAGVSKQTVSRVLNGTGRTSERTRRRVEQAIRELNYRRSGVARSLATNSSLTLGLVVPALDNPYYADIAQGAELAAWEAGYNLFLCNVFQDAGREGAALRSLEERGADGVIVDTPRLPDGALAELLGRYKAAVVIGREVPLEVASSIVVDDAAGVQLALGALHDAERRRVALLAGPDLYASSTVRREAFVRSERERGLFDPARVVIADTSPEASFAATLELLSRTPFDALVCFNDIMAAGALRALQVAGVRVPEEVAVVGHDDIPMAAWLSPPLATVRVPKREIGQRAVATLIAGLSGAANTRVVLTPELTVRESLSGMG